MLRLPVELRALLVQLPQLRQQPPSLPARRLVSLAASVHSGSAARSADAAAPAKAAHDAGPGLFEPATPEYAVVPLSTLDHPPEARTPKQALAALVAQRRFDEADAILADVLAANEVSLGSGPISLRSQYLARHTRRLFRESRDSNWLAWWQVTHRAPSDPVAAWLKGTVHHENFTREICERLAFEGDVRAIEQFALLAAEAGFERLVAAHFLVHLALYAPRDVGERVWLKCVESLRLRKITARNAAPRIGSRRDVAPGLLKKRIASAESFLATWRSAMIKAHLSMGRIELAVALLTQPHTLTIPNKSFSAGIYLDTLHYTAAAGRFDLFLTTFRALELRNERLIRARPSMETDNLRGTLYYTRRAAPAAAAAPLSVARATYDSYRARDAPDSEPAFPSALGDISDSSAIDTLPTPTLAPATLASLTITSGSTQLVRSTESYQNDAAFAKALAVEGLGGATRIFDQSLRTGLAPSLMHTARYIHMLRKRGHARILATIPMAIAESARDEWMSRYWASAAMLAAVLERRHMDAIKAFTATFQLAGLPDPVRRALVAVAPVPDVPCTGPRPPRPLAVPSHALAIAFEALIPQLMAGQDSTSSPSSVTVPAAIDELYACLASPASEFNIIHRTRLVPGFDATSSPLHPSTFLPFLLAFARARRPPLALLHVLRDMQRLGLACPKHHWGVVTGAFARSAPPADTAYLLAALERRETPSPSAPAPAPDPELVELLAQLALPPEAPDVVVFTAAIRGLTLQAEYDAAWDLVDRVPRDGERDAVLQRALALLKHASRARGERGAPKGS